MIVNLNDFKTFVSVLDNTQDTLLAGILHAGDQRVREYLGYDPEPHGTYTETHFVRKYLYPHYAPIVSITSITDEDGNVLDDDDYEISGLCINIPGAVDSTDKYTLVYHAGYEASDIPEDLKMAVKIVAESIYSRRGSFGMSQENIRGYSAQYHEGMPPMARELLSGYKRKRV